MTASGIPAPDRARRHTRERATEILARASTRGMAKSNQKKRAEENLARLTLLFRALVASVACHAAVRLGVYRATTIWWVHYPLFAVAAGSAWFCYASLAHIGTPTYDASGVLVDAGADLSLGGMSSYYHDIVYVAVFLLVATALVSDWFWLLGLAVPAYATYMLWAKIILPWIFTPTADEAEANARMNETKEQRKKRELKERRAERRGRGRGF